MAAEAGFAQGAEEERALAGVHPTQFAVVAVRHLDGGCRRFLQWSGRADGEKVVHLAHRVRQRWFGEDVAEPPTSDAERLGEPADRDRAVVHTRQSGHGHVFAAVVEDVLVDLIRDAKAIELLAEGGNLVQFRPCEDLAAGVVRSVHDDRAGALSESSAKLRGVEREFEAVERDEDEGGAAHRRVRHVVFVERLEDDDLIAGLNDGEHGGHHRLGRAAGDGDLAVRVQVQAGEAQGLGGDRFAQAGGAPGDGVLVDIGVDRVDRGLLDEIRGGKVRVALGEVYRPVEHRQARHLADHGFVENGGARCRVGGTIFHGRILPDVLECRTGEYRGVGVAGSDGGLRTSPILRHSGTPVLPSRVAVPYS